MKIFQLEEEIKPEIISKLQSEIKLKEGELLDKETELKLLLDRVGESSQILVEKLKEDEKNLRIKHSRLHEIKDRIINAINEINGITNINVLIENVNRDVPEFDIKLNVPNIAFGSQIETLNTITDLINDKAKSIIDEISLKKSDIEKLSGLEKEQATLLTGKDVINSNLEQLKSQLHKLESKEKDIISLEAERRRCYLRFIEGIVKLKSVYELIISAFSKGKNDILSNIDFRSSIYFDNNKFEEDGEEIFNLKKVHLEEIKGLSDELGKVISDSDNFSSCIDSYLLSGSRFKSAQSLKKGRNSLDLYNWLFDSYFVLNTEIFFNNKHMENLSMGQKGTVLLKIFLAEGDHPLFIDQPEENLDNKFVYEALVNAFREAKKKRQIIIATHNANLVVNTDAEQVIIADYLNNEISYRSGSIENPTIREDITTLLEGGEEAFRKRERRYSK